MEIIAVQKALRKQGVEEIYVEVLEDIYKENITTIKHHKVSKKIQYLAGNAISVSFHLSRKN